MGEVAASAGEPAGATVPKEQAGFRLKSSEPFRSKDRNRT